MAMPQWSQDYLLGNKTIDDEHQHLMDVLVNLEKQLLGEQPLDRAGITAAVAELNVHVEVHFRHEEVLMTSLAIMPESERAAHRRDHSRWRQRVHENLKPMSAAHTDLELRAYLGRVLLVGKAFWEEHFRVFDRRMEAYMGNKG